MKDKKIVLLYAELLKNHGSPQKFWPQWCADKKSSKTREVISIGALLTQRTAWHNAELALKSLKKANLLSIKKISNLTNLEKLTELIKPAGFYQVKPKRLWKFCKFVTSQGGLERLLGEKATTLRKRLLELEGVGPETADTLLCYALEKPCFVIDEYTRRLVKKKKLARKFDNDSLKELFEKSLPKKVRLFQDFHALIIIEQKGETGSVMNEV